MERNASVKSVSVGEISGPLQPRRKSDFEYTRRGRKNAARDTSPVNGTELSRSPQTYNHRK